MTETSVRTPATTTGLRWATGLFAIALLVHGADHFRRGMGSISTTVMTLGSLQTALALVTIALVFAGHRWAPPAAIGIGFASAIGFTLVHLFPDWFGPFSDSFIDPPADAGVTGFSWFAAIFEVIADLLIGFAGLRAFRRSR